MIVLSNNIVLGTVNEAATHSHLGIFPKTITITITIMSQMTATIIVSSKSIYFTIFTITEPNLYLTGPWNQLGIYC